MVGNAGQNRDRSSTTGFPVSAYWGSNRRIHMAKQWPDLSYADALSVCLKEMQLNLVVMAFAKTRRKAQH